jgi:cytidylate kinase
MTSIGSPIAVDGPIGSGKSSVALALSRMLGYRCISTGLMYRAVAVLVSDVGDAGRSAAADRIARESEFLFADAGDTVHITVNGQDLTEQVGDPAVLPLTSQVAQDPALRATMLDRQRLLALDSPCVIEGRDVGSVIVPDAPWKFYLDADAEVRYQRLYAIHAGRHGARAVPYADFVRQMQGVDQRDAARLAESRRRPGIIYHRNFAELSAYQDAVILYYYLRRSAEICCNTTQLVSRQSG